MMMDMSYHNRMPGADLFDLRHMATELDSLEWNYLESSESQADLLHWLIPICSATVVMLGMITIAALVMV